MKERSWTIGSLPDCDLQVDSPAVSGRHCRLSQQGQTFVLEDLASTNGTFVAGERIDRPREVRRGEAITLGQNTPMPWPNLSSITVGRLPDNDVVIPLDMVSGHHARLEREGNRVFLVDLESRNGTAINDPLKKITRAPIRAGDVVFLGTHKVMASDLLSKMPADVPDPRAARQATRLEASPLADLGVRPWPAAPAPAAPVTAPAALPPRAGWLGSYRSARNWAVGIGLSVACILIAIAVSSAFRAGATDNPRVADEPGAVNGAGTGKGGTNDDPRNLLLKKLQKEREEKKAQAEKERQRKAEEAIKKNREQPKDQP
jgi:pSer/pThr/pTyr-binding forkhead associated (FHA) protein